MTQATDAPRRPLSPHLQIYRWGITNSLSILHRATGLVLSLGLLVLASWLVAVASGPDAYAGLMTLYGSIWFKLPLAAFAFCFFYHLGNGVRHLFWDAGRGFSHAAIRAGGIAVVVFALAATALYVAIGIFR
jgi:succinate dehydrogenase / fumarate reductase cytochrome b subunit